MSSYYWKKKQDALNRAKRNNPSMSADDALVNIIKDRERSQIMRGLPVKNPSWFQAPLFKDGYDFGDVSRTILGTTKDVSDNVTTAFVDLAENAIDIGGTVVGGVGNIFSKDFGDKTRAFVAKDLLRTEDTGKALGMLGPFSPMYAGVEATARAVDEFKNPGTHTASFEDFLDMVDSDKTSLLGEKADSLIQSATDMAGAIALTAAKVPMWIPIAYNAFSGEIENAFQNDATYTEAVTSATVSAVSEVLLEKVTGGLLSKTGVDDAILKPLLHNVKNKVAKSLVKFGWKGLGEAGEEVAQEFIGNLTRKLTYEDEKTWKEALASPEAMQGYLDAIIGAAVMSSGGQAVEIAGAKSSGKDYVSGMTETEQKVFDKVYEAELAKEGLSKDGVKGLPKKGKIYDQILEQMKRGEISTDTIEEVLGGERYKNYKATVDSEDAKIKQLKDQLAELGKQPNSVENTKKYDALDSRIKEMQEKSERNKLHNELSDEVFGIVKDSRLAESYNQKAQRGQKFRADVSKYNDRQKKVVQAAMDSGVLNNTRRTHEFVDFIAKLSEKINVDFDFTSNEKLKDTIYSVEGATVNGYFDRAKGSIGININSAKALNSVVGHEITHVLEGTEFYDALKNTVVKYAQSKGDYSGRVETLKKLYKEENIDSELVADLVGDYLFTDSDFVNRITAENRPLAQKLLDQVKYMCKIATAGSKEARQLEKIKKTFEDAFKQDRTKNTAKDGGVKRSISETTDGRLVAVVDSDILYEIDTSSWDDAKKELAKSAAVDALRKFKGGIAVDGITRKVNRTSRREFTRSKDTEDLYNNAPDIFADKMRAADVADDIVIATTGWVRDGKLYHPRKDNFVDFDHGKTLIMSGKSKYVAEVVVGITKTGEAVFYDVVDMTPTTFDIKKEESPTTATTQNAPGDINGDSTDNSVTQNGKEVKRSLSDSDGNQLTQEQQDYFKDSKIRDENGNLKVMYHGSQAAFTVFDRNKARSSGYYGRGFYFTDSDAHAKQYGNTYEVYLNITNPLHEGTYDITKEQLRKFVEVVAENEDYGLDNYGDGATVDGVTDSVYGKSDFAMLMDINASCVGNMVETIELFNEVNGTDYNGIVVPTETVAFYPNQIKSVDNLTPTQDPDVNRSLSKPGEQTKTYGSYNVTGEDIALAPVGKPIAPVSQTTAQTTAPVSQTKVAPTAITEELFPDNLAPIQQELEALEQRKADLEGQIRDAVMAEDADALEKANAQYAPIAPLPEPAPAKPASPVEHKPIAPVAPNASVGAAASGFDPLTHLQYEYGTLPEGENPVRDDSLPKSTTGEDKVSLTARTVKGAQATPDELVDLLDKETVGGRFSYIPITNSETVTQAYNDIVKKGWEAARGEWEVRVRRGEVSAELTATGSLLLNNAAKAGDRKAWLSVLHDYQLMGTNAGQAVQAMRILKTLTPDDSLYMIERSVEQMVEDMKPGTKIKIDETLKQNYLDAKTDAEKESARKAIAKNIAKQIPPTLMDKWTALRYMNMLGNFRTQVRNIIGNMGMAVTQSAKNVVATSIESLAHKASGGKFRRTKSMFVNKDQLRAAREDFANVKHIALNGGKYNDPMSQSAQLEQEIQDARRIFWIAPLEWYRKGTNWAMDTGDMIFSKAAYARALAGYLKANKITETDFSKIDQQTLDAARTYAINDARETTFRDNNWLSSWVSKIGRHKNTPKFIKTLSEGVMPFRKTPANILLRAEEYSPLGLINATVNSIKAAKNPGEITGADVVNSWAKAMTGTGLFALGVWLSNSGMLSGGEDEDEDKEWFEDQYGWQNYALHIGGYNFTIDFLAPAAMPILMGAQLNELRQNGGIELKDLESALLSIADPMIEMSMLQGANDALEDIRYAESNMGQFLINAALSYLTQGLTNSFAGQIERSLDGQRMTTFVDKDSSVPAWLQKAIGKASAKFPVLDYQQIPYIDAWGETENIAPLPALIENTLSPSYIEKGVSDFVYEELNRLNDAQSDINVYPQTPDKTVSFVDADGNRHENYNLSADEYVELAKLQGQTQKALVEEILSNDRYEGLTDPEKAKAIQLAYKYAREFSRKEVLNADGFSSKWMGEADDVVDAIISHTSEEKTYAYQNPDNYAIAKAVGGYEAYTGYSKALSGIKADKDKNGKNIANSRKTKVFQYINGLDISRGEKLILFKKEYPGDDTYNREIVSYIKNRSDISAADKNAILKELGFMK